MPCWEMTQCFITTLKKAVNNVGWEATSILVLKRRIKEWTRQIPLPNINIYNDYSQGQKGIVYNG